MNKTIQDYVKEIHKNAKSKGWWIEKRTPLEIHALIHTEISEATEEVRKGNIEDVRTQIIHYGSILQEHFDMKIRNIKGCQNENIR